MQIEWNNNNGRRIKWREGTKFQFNEQLSKMMNNKSTFNAIQKLREVGRMAKLESEQKFSSSNVIKDDVAQP